MKGLYIHIPFCGLKCQYCDFTAFSGRRSSRDDYIKAVSAEMEHFSGFSAETLYIGGGTPSELSCPQIKALLSAVEKKYGKVGDFRESAFEANPESLTRDRIMLLKQFGIGRISLGFQAAQDNLLKTLGRRHTVSDFKNVFNDLKAVGFSNINVDLMTAIPGQTLDDFRETLSLVCSMGAAHVSFYSLQVEEKTLFHKRGIKTDDDMAREMFDFAREKLAAEGYIHYEISNFARPGMESLHNLNYWNNGEYLGLGCGASSYIGGVRRTNPSTLNLYMEPLLSGEGPVFSAVEELSGKEKLGETILLGLRKTEGIELAAEVKKEFEKEFRKLEGKGLVELKGDRIMLTKEGVYLGNAAFREFVPPYD